ncbi:MAG: HDOD domain-containing protein [Bryobacteraceae bacterium]
MTEFVEPRLGAGPCPSEILKQKALRSLGDLPLFPTVLNRLMASLAGEDVSFARIGDLVEKDTVLAGNLLQMVNSALYARRGTVNSVRHALSLLGIDKVRNAVLGMSLTRMWNLVKMPPSWSMTRFNLHSSATAILSDLLAQRLPVEYPEGAFAAGLLHDLGRLLIALSLPAEHERILALNENGARLRVDCEIEVLGFTHAELSAEALAAWNLPAPICEAAHYHHQIESEEGDGSGEIPLFRIVRAANNYVNSMGVSIRADHSLDCADPTMIASLGLDADQGIELLAEFKAEQEATAMFFR